jgi:hypothetical protein
MTGYSPTLSTDTIREDGTRSWWRAFSGHQTQKGFFKFPYQITINQTSSLGNSQRQVVFPLSRPTMQNGRQNTVGEHSDETEPADRQPTRRGRWSGSWRCHVRCKYSPGSTPRQRSLPLHSGEQTCFQDSGGMPCMSCGSRGLTAHVVWLRTSSWRLEVPRPSGRRWSSLGDRPRGRGDPWRTALRWQPRLLRYPTINNYGVSIVYPMQLNMVMPARSMNWSWLFTYKRKRLVSRAAQRSHHIIIFWSLSPRDDRFHQTLFLLVHLRFLGCLHPSNPYL